MIRIAVCDDENVIVNQIEHIISEVCKRESIPVNIDVLILSILVDTFISKISFPMQPGPEIGSISDA